MISPRHAGRLLTAIAVGSLLTAALTTLTTPAEAAPREVFTQSEPVYLGDTSYGVEDSRDYAIPAGGSTAPSPLELEVGQAARIAGMAVTVDLEHGRPSDLELVLVGPTGEQVVLLNGAGGDAFTAATPTFSDAAEETLDTATEKLSDTVVRPASFGPIDLKTDPPVTGGTALSVFDGTNAGGTWRLYVHDEKDHLDDDWDSGDLFSWTLSFQLVTSPYPSALSVSASGELVDVNVSLHDIESPAATDIDLLLIGPLGHQSLLMSDVGGFDPVSGVDLVLDDGGETIPAQTALTSGTYRPTDQFADTFPGVPSPTRAVDLSVFNGTDPHGLWSLYAVDDSGNGYVSAILGGWSLDLVTAHPTALVDTTPPTGTVTLSGGSAYATSTAVTLSLGASDPGLAASGVRQMRFSNDGTTFAPWQPYASGAGWTLAGGKDGARTVYAQFADGAGNISAAVSDTIVLDATGPTNVKIKPAKNAKGVKPSAKVKVVASELLDTTSVTGKTVKLTKSGKKIKAVVSLTKGKTIVLTPKQALTRGTYKVTVTSRVTDLPGNAFDARSKPGTQTLRWSFTV